jgi:hypothetical protein
VSGSEHNQQQQAEICGTMTGGPILQRGGSYRLSQLNHLMLHDLLNSPLE